MTTRLTITSFGHATVELESSRHSIVIDPGVFAPNGAFDHSTAFLITHEHDDHIDVDRIVAALHANSAAHVWAPEAAQRRLTQAGAREDQITSVTSRGQFHAAGMTVQPILGTHATIHSKLPESPNIAYLIDDRILHPGDAFPAVPGNPKIDILFLPVSGPWLRISDAIDYVEALQPSIVIPIHDGDLNESGRALTDQLGPIIGGHGHYQRLEVGEPTEF